MARRIPAVEDDEKIAAIGGLYPEKRGRQPSVGHGGRAETVEEDVGRGVEPEAT